MTLSRLQAGLYYARRNRLNRSIVAGLAAWSNGLSITTAGTYVQYGGNVYKALGTGTTGSTPPTQDSGDQSDGTVNWQYVDPQTLGDDIYNKPVSP